MSILSHNFNRTGEIDLLQKRAAVKVCRAIAELDKAMAEAEKLGMIIEEKPNLDRVKMIYGYWRSPV